MRVLQVYNQYRSLFNGEDEVVSRTVSLIRKSGGTCDLWIRSSRGLDESFGTKFRAFMSGIYSRRSYKEMQSRLAESAPDVVHAHNLYPLLSPSVLVACRRAGTPVVMTVHNHSFTCPRSDHLCRGSLCEKCRGGREYHCILNNCRENILESVAYATRSAYARRMRLFHDNVNIVIALTEFARQRFLERGFAPEQVEILPNMFAQSHPAADPENGSYVAYAGRMSGEKGVVTLLRAAALAPQCKVRLAGDGPLLDQFKRDATDNVEFAGRLARDEMADFYRRAKFVVIPSHCFEMCPLVITEAMSHGIPVVASRIGGLAEMVSDQDTGLLFQPTNAEELAAKMKQLWNDPDQCRRLGRTAHEAARQRDENKYYQELLAIYRKARQRAGLQPLAEPSPTIEFEPSR